MISDATRYARVKAVCVESETRWLEQLTPSEHKVLTMMVEGYTYAEMAAKWGVKYRTIHTHVSNIFAKLGVKSYPEAIRVARRLGYSADAELPQTSAEALALARRYLDLARELLEKGQ